MTRRLAALCAALMLFAGCGKTSREALPGTAGDPGANAPDTLSVPLPAGVRAANLTGLPEGYAMKELFVLTEDVIAVRLVGGSAPEGKQLQQLWFYNVPEDKVFAHIDFGAAYPGCAARVEGERLYLTFYSGSAQSPRQSEEFCVSPDGSYDIGPSQDVRKQFNPSGTLYVMETAEGVVLGRRHDMEGNSEEELLLPKVFTGGRLRQGYTPVFWVDDRRFAYKNYGEGFLGGTGIFDVGAAPEHASFPTMINYQPYGEMVGGSFLVAFPNFHVETRHPVFVDVTSGGYTTTLAGLALTMERHLTFSPDGGTAGFVTAAETEGGGRSRVVMNVCSLEQEAVLLECGPLPHSIPYCVSVTLWALGPEYTFSSRTADTNRDNIFLVEVPKAP